MSDNHIAQHPNEFWDYDHAIVCSTCGCIDVPIVPSDKSEMYCSFCDEPFFHANKLTGRLVPNPLNSKLWRHFPEVWDFLRAIRRVGGHDD